MEKFTKEQAIIITGYTGCTACNFSDFHEDVEKRLGYPVFTDQFGDRSFTEKIRMLYREDFINLCP